MPPPLVRLLIVDDDPLVLSSLRLYFGSPAGESILVVGEASTGQEALDILNACARDEPVDVVLADIHLPGMDGVELLGRVRQLPDPPVFVAMTALDEEETMLSVLAQGGRGYILKSSRPEFIIDTVLATVNGGTVVSPQPASNLVRHLAPETSETVPLAPPGDASPAKKVPDAPVLPRLSASEEKILSLLCIGLSNAEISRRSGRSSSMVKKQVSQLLSKFGASTRVQLAVLAVEAGFRPDDIR
ncbi:Two-component system, response regulator [Corynebacterium glyciniphilum AJ 3170]|uniref:Two-component system, response regulator n=1 Tax=Corynebacterium glyciniphilum AJ 3170 TaxID=1404245 RepID=X5DVM6_9CORY|nr:response regulator transcription factor [Corynebacterium glyciniphilum]AHW65374.1 Two-component system, response regulator [Corynebacterium glyciniphilum AJ 3170]